MFKEIHVVDKNDRLFKQIESNFVGDFEYKFILVEPENLEVSLKRIPSTIIINDEFLLDDSIYNICKEIRESEDNSITPIIVVTQNNDIKYEISILNESVEYVINSNQVDLKISCVVKNLSRLLSANRTVSPLTGLPGNLPIQKELKKRLFTKSSFVVMYFDLDNFKAYNDTYGFLKGDEIIRLTSNLINRNVHLIENTDVFIGHIGGDDFVAITDGDVEYEKICQNIITEFDIEIQKYFTDLDLERGYIEIQNRKGVVEQFPLTSISIGVVVADSKRFANILEIGEIGAQVKHLSKSVTGSAYAIDRREDKYNN